MYMLLGNNAMLKKLFYVSLFFFILLLILLIAYNFAFKNNVNDPKVSEAESITKELDTALQENASPVSTKIENPLNEEVSGAAMGPEGDLYYYSFSDEQLKKSTAEGKNKQTLLSNLPGAVERLVWSPNRTQVLLALRQGTSLRWHHLNIATKSLTPLKTAISRVAWSQNGEKIYYQYLSANGERSLDVADPSGSNFSTLTKIGRLDHFVASIPQSNRVAIWTRPNGLEATVLESVTQTGTEKKTLLTNRYGTDYLWSPNGKYILFSSVRTQSGADLSLSIMNENGGEIRDLGIPTMVSKAVWAKDSKTIYYALPGNLPGTSVLPNDYYQTPLYSEDTFWKIDIETGQKSRVLELEEAGPALDSSDLFLSNKEDYLFFTDRKSRRLYRIEL